MLSAFPGSPDTPVISAVFLMSNTSQFNDVRLHIGVIDAVLCIFVYKGEMQLKKFGKSWYIESKIENKRQQKP